MMPTHNRNKDANKTRGVALVTTLLLLSLFTVMTLAMVIATTSDTLITGYYRNFRGSFYAADSGLNATREYLLSQLQSESVPTGYDPSSGTVPFSASAISTIISGLNNSSSGFGAYQSIDGSQSSWSEQFKVDPTSTNTYINVPAAPVVNTVGTVTTYTFPYSYKLTVIGQSSANLQNTVEETGTFNVAIPVTNTTTSGTSTSFAAWGTLFNTYAICGSPFVKGTMTGPFFSNDSWNFGDNGLVGNGSYIFTGSVGAHNANVGYMYSDGTCHQSSATSDSETVTTTTTTGSGKNKKTVTTTTTTTIAPQFEGGLNTGQAAVPLPQDSFNQALAVINGRGGCPPAGTTGYSCPTPTQAQMMTLTNAHGTSWPSTGSPSTGVYLPYSVSGSTKTFNGGGIYVQGNADAITMTAGTSGSDNTQVFTITQGSVVTTVTLDLTAQTTRVTDNQGNDTHTITGIPENLTGATPSEACMLYVNGAISGTDSHGNTTGLSGPSSGAAIQDGSAVTVTSTGTIAITGNITYSHEPVTLTQQGSTPADTLIPGVTNVLGIYTSGGDIQMRPTSNVSSLEVDASLAMIQNGGSGGMVAQWNSIGTLTIVGGRIANNAKSGASLTTRNIWFDQRFGSGGFAPPWFPSTIVGTGTVTTSSVGSTTVTASRQSWVNTTAQ